MSGSFSRTESDLEVMVDGDASRINFLRSPINLLCYSR